MSPINLIAFRFSVSFHIILDIFFDIRNYKHCNIRLLTVNINIYDKPSDVMIQKLIRIDEYLITTPTSLES